LPYLRVLFEETVTTYPLRPAAKEKVAGRPDEGLAKESGGYRFCVGSAPARFSASSEAAQLI